MCQQLVDKSVPSSRGSQSIYLVWLLSSRRSRSCSHNIPNSTMCFLLRFVTSKSLSGFCRGPNCEILDAAEGLESSWGFICAVLQRHGTKGKSQEDVWSCLFHGFSFKRGRNRSHKHQIHIVVVKLYLFIFYLSIYFIYFQDEEAQKELDLLGLWHPVPCFHGACVCACESVVVRRHVSSLCEWRAVRGRLSGWVFKSDVWPVCVLDWNESVKKKRKYQAFYRNGIDAGGPLCLQSPSIHWGFVPSCSVVSQTRCTQTKMLKCGDLSTTSCCPR